MAVGLEMGPKYLDQSKLYRLKPGEEIIFSKAYSSQGWRDRRIPQKEIRISPEFNTAYCEAMEEAKRIEASPVVDPIKEELVVMTSEQERQGLFRNIRVEVMRDVVTGHRLKGFTLIGIPQ